MRNTAGPSQVGGLPGDSKPQVTRSHCKTWAAQADLLDRGQSFAFALTITTVPALSSSSKTQAFVRSSLLSLPQLEIPFFLDYNSIPRKQ